MPGDRCGTPTPIRGVTYPSMSAAARALGVSVTAVSKAARDNRLDRLGPACPSYRGPCPVSNGRQSFPSIAAASRATGIGENRIATLLRLGLRGWRLAEPEPTE